MRRAVGRALASDTVLTLPLIMAEVVQGAPDEETLEELAEDFSALEWVSMGENTALTAARLGYALRRSGRPVPVTDLLIARHATCSSDADPSNLANPLRSRRLFARLLLRLNQLVRDSPGSGYRLLRPDS